MIDIKNYSYRDAWLLSVDPGKTGAVALFEPGFKKAHVMSFAKSDTIAEAFMNLREISKFNKNHHRCIGVIEKAQASPQMGVSSAFSYGYTYAETNATMATEFILYGDSFVGGLAEVAPSQWKPALGLSRDKNHSVRQAEAMPCAKALLNTKKLTHDQAEALLLGLYYQEILKRKGFI
jgi:hypothetical protein